jgi:ferredoxin-thioredoxin reductase catalytic subunit
MAEQNKTEVQFRSDLESVVSLVEGLSAYCEKTEQLADMCRLALENEGQLKLLMAAMKAKR